MRTLKFFIVSILTTLVMPSAINAQTFTEDIADIVYNQCSTCHRPGEIGPMNLTNYDEIKSYGQTIKAVTSLRYMPPWQPDSDYSRVMDENYLTDEQIETIANWVDNGMPEGPASAEPPFPDYPEGSLLGTPDLVLDFAEAHVHEGNNKDEYRYFVLPTGLTEDKIVKAIELRPGNSRIVHHSLFFEDRTGTVAQYDAQTPEYGFDAFSSAFDISQVLSYDQYPGYVPGTKPRYYPEGLGQMMHAGSDLVMQMHYAPSSVDEIDQSSVNIFFADEGEQVDRIVKERIMLPSDLPGGFFNFTLLPEQTRSFHGTWFINEDVSLMGLSPHMHLLGTDWEVYVERPDGTRENLISIPEWDFNWQGAYYFPKFVVAPFGSVVHAIAGYDNTSENFNNPNDPPQFVSWGENTDDEMYYLPLFYVPYEDGDEDIVFEDVSTSTIDVTNITNQSRLLPIRPNPISGDQLVSIPFNLDRGQVIDISIYDLKGQLIKKLRTGEFFGKGYHIAHFDSGQLAEGSYLVNLKSKYVNVSEKFVKVKG